MRLMIALFSLLIAVVLLPAFIEMLGFLQPYIEEAPVLSDFMKSYYAFMPWILAFIVIGGSLSLLIKRKKGAD